MLLLNCNSFIFDNLSKQSKCVVSLTDNLKTTDMRFSLFQSAVSAYCTPDDFKSHKDFLKDVDSTYYSEYLTLLKMGCTIHSSLLALERIVKFSEETPLTVLEVIDCINRSRLIISIMDSK